MARELHDVIAHCVSVMVVQTGAARTVANSDAAAARTALRVVEATGREALDDLRRLVGTRRREIDDWDGVLPGDGLGGIVRVETARATGLPVDLHVDPAPLPIG